LSNDVVAKLAGWAKRDASVPVTAWTPEQREIYESAGRVLRGEADQAVDLARATPHRVMRELYEQTVVYFRAYADSIPSYRPEDDALARVGNSTAGAIFRICDAITNLSAIDRAPLVPTVAPPSTPAPVGDPNNPQRFLTGPSPVCSRLRSQNSSDDAQLSDWLNLRKVAVAQWNPGDKAIWDDAGRILTLGAAATEEIGRSSGNPVVADFLVLSAQYYRAFVAAIPSFAVPDAQLYSAAQNAAASVDAACDAVIG
jgi:hypothetical protein